MDKINEMLNRLADLNPEELNSLKDSIVSEFDSLDAQESRTVDAVEAMTSLASAHEQIEAETGRRQAEAEELSNRAEEAALRIKGGSTEAKDSEEEEDVKKASEAAATPAKKDDDEDEVSEEEEDEDKKDKKGKKLKEFSSESEEATETPAVETELSTEAPEAEVEAPAEAAAELAVEEAPVEEPAAETELSSETQADGEAVELSVEETVETPSTDDTELSVEDNTQESEENPVTASVNSNFEAPAENAPAAQEEEATHKVATITAAADIKGFSSGDSMPNLRAVAQAVLDRRKGMSRTSGGDGEQALVASISHSDFYSDDRILDSADFEGNREKIEAVVASLKGADQALVAAGGLYGPVDTSWDIYELGETLGRPVKDSLPSFSADRGGLRFITAPLLADLEGAVSIWTLQDDIDAAVEGSLKVKPCIRVAAGVEVTVYLEAMPLCLTFGNLGARAFPEMVERHIALAMVWQARYAETRLLTRIGALSTKVTAAAELGAARDIFVQVEKVSSALRNRHRLDAEAPLKAMFPVWFKNALRADLVKQMPGDGQDNAFNLADSTIDRWFAARNINVSWFIDGEEGQIMGEQAAGALNGFPTDVVWYIFPEGTFLFLDGGTLDLGLVRDSTLNATNDYKLFLETFENVAKVGVESLQITSAVQLAGSAAALTKTTTP